MDQDGMNELRELISYLKEHGVAEFDMERPELKVRLKFQGAGAAEGVATAATMAEMARLMAAAQAAPAATIVPMPVAVAGAGEAVALAGSAAVVAAAAAEKLHEVRSPLVGTFYESPSPGASPFVKIGDMVEVGQVLGIVEAMKLMNEIEADASGEVVRRVATSGQPVEYGQPLFEIRPR